MLGYCRIDGVGKEAAEKVLQSIRRTDAMSKALDCLEQEPLQILGEICRLYQKTEQPVPDYNLHPSGYMGEVAIKALIEAKLVKMHPAPKYSLYHYEPTEEALKHYHNLKEAGYYERRQ